MSYWKSAAGNGGASKRSDQSFQPSDLHPFAGNLRDPMRKGIVFNLVDYLQLVDWTGRCIREDKVGAIESHAEPILCETSGNIWDRHSYLKHITIHIIV